MKTTWSWIVLMCFAGPMACLQLDREQEAGSGGANAGGGPTSGTGQEAGSGGASAGGGSASGTGGQEAGSGGACADGGSASGTGPSGEIGHWTMNEGVGPNIADSSGNGNNGTRSGTEWATGCSGTGLLFDGVDDFVDLGFAVGADLDGAPAISLSAWIKVKSLPEPGTTGNTIFQTRINEASNGFSVLMNGPNYLVIGARSIISDKHQAMKFESDVTGGWKHVVAIVDYAQKSMTMYVDGVPQPPLSSPPTFNASQYSRGDNHTQTDRIGSSPANTEMFNGTIDEVRIYPRALTEEEVNALFKAGG